MAARSWFVKAGAALLVAVGCGGQSATASNPPPIKLSGSDNGGAVACTADGKLDIQLQTIGPGEYEAPTVSSEAVRFLSETPGDVNPGGQNQIFHFACVNPGSASIEIAHSEGNRTFLLTVDVR